MLSTADKKSTHAEVITLNARVTYCRRLKCSKECLISVETPAFYFRNIIHHWSHIKEHAKQNVPGNYYCLQLRYRCGEKFPWTVETCCHACEIDKAVSQVATSRLQIEGNHAWNCYNRFIISECLPFRRLGKPQIVIVVLFFFQSIDRDSIATLVGEFDLPNTYWLGTVSLIRYPKICE